MPAPALYLAGTGVRAARLVWPLALATLLLAMLTAGRASAGRPPRAPKLGARPALPPGPASPGLPEKGALPAAPVPAALGEVGVLGVALSAASVSADGQTLHARGDVRLSSMGWSLRAAWIDVDMDTGDVVVAPDALWVAGDAVTACGAMAFNLHETHAHAQRIRLAVHAGGADAAVAALGPLAATRGAGRTLWATAESMDVGTGGDGHVRLKDVVLTACACDPTAIPAWQVRTRAADIVPGDAVHLSLPVVELFGLPVLPLPYLQVPLAERRSGLLFPKFSFRRGMWVEAPVFIALSDWADMTVAPGLIFTGSLDNLALAGRMSGEARWHPYKAHRGQATLSYQWDAPTENRATPHRLAARLGHTSALGKRSRLVLDGRWVSDRNVVGDLGFSVGDRVASVLRSSAKADLVGSTGGLYAMTAYDQDLEQPRIPLVGADLARRVQDVGQLGAVFLPTALLTLGDAALWTAAEGHVQLAHAVGAFEDRPLLRTEGLRTAIRPTLGLSWGGPWGALSTRLTARGIGVRTADGESAGRVVVSSYSALSTRIVGQPAPELEHVITPSVYGAAVPYVHGVVPVVVAADLLTRGAELGAKLEQRLRWRQKYTADLTAALALPTNGAGMWSMPGGLLELSLAGPGAGARLLLTGALDAREPELLDVAFHFPLAGVKLSTGWWRMGATRPRLYAALDGEGMRGWSWELPTGAVRDRLWGSVSGAADAWRWSVEAAEAMGSAETGGAPAAGLWTGGKLGYHAPCDCLDVNVSIRFWPTSAQPLSPDVRFGLTLSGGGQNLSLF